MNVRDTPSTTGDRIGHSWPHLSLPSCGPQSSTPSILLSSQLDAELEPRPLPPNAEFTSTPSSFPPADTQTHRPFWVDQSEFNAYYHFPDLSTSSNEHSQLKIDDQLMAKTIHSVQVAHQDGLGASLLTLPLQQAVDPEFLSNGSDSESNGKDDRVSSISSKCLESSSVNEEDSINLWKANEDDDSAGDCNKKNLKPTVTYRKKHSCMIKDIPNTLWQDILNAEHQEVTDMTVDAWDAALAGLVDEATWDNIDDPMSAELNLIWDHGSQFHRQLKDIVHLLLVDIYGFQDIKKLCNPNKNRIEAAKAAN
ncbi:hypothetical protein IW262DRAFT_1297175 [Armillaria fumosa]|nr:hypothetical protein IW262DRAFT_1297175 [Armillaria fumosa]